MSASDLQILKNIFYSWKRMDGKTVKKLMKLGFSVSVCGRKHYKLTHPELAIGIIVPNTPSDFRSMRNNYSFLRKNLER